MSNSRVWLFRGLVIVAVGLMLLSWFMPWWSMSIAALELENAVIIHPWGLEEHLGMLSGYMYGSEMPGFFAPLMWIYLGICVALLLFSLLAKEKVFSLGKFKFSLPRVIIGVIGFSYIVVVVSAVIVAAIRTGDFFNTHLIGITKVEIFESHPSYVEANLRIGYWLACAVGPLSVVLALLRSKIIGKPKSVV